MSVGGPPEEPLTPAQERVEGYLGLLREEPPQPGRELVPATVRRARWQLALRTPLRALGHLLTAMADGVALIAGSRRRREDSR
ncbi:MAG: hypothetical protein ACR2ML_13100 [Solirubrobacteraceae bacterium]